MGYNVGLMVGCLDLVKIFVFKVDYFNICFRKVMESNSLKLKEDLGGGSWFVCNSNLVKFFFVVGFIYV